MIPPTLKAFASALTDGGFEGDVSDDIADRIALSTDNSVYQVMPSLVIAPRHRGDCERLMALAAEERFATVRFAPRGGGTGTNGQSLSDQVLVDTSRYMNRILEIDPEAGRVRVEPGVVLGQLNRALAPYGLFFPPHTSTASRATVGGMVGTDACGKGSRRYGRTGDYVLGASLALPDGRRYEFQRYTAAEASAAENAGTRAASALRAIVCPHREAIRDRFPAMSRSLTGYNLRDAFPEDGTVDPARLIAGAEGTLGLVTELSLRVIPAPRHQALVVVRYHDFDDALADAHRLLEAEPSAVETLDQRIFELARADGDWPAVREALAGDRADDAPPLVTNFIEFRDSDPAGVEAAVERLRTALQRRDDHAGFHVTDDGGLIARLWGVRAKGVGLLGRTPGRRKPVPFVEDTVVPPEHLADYIREFRALLDRHGVDYGMFGHVDVGCLHVRPALDMTDPEDAKRLRAISDEVVELVGRYHGLLWGEHGKGVRGEYTRTFFGDELYGVLAAVKRFFDPDNRMNPGKIVAPDAAPEGVWRIDGVPMRGEHERSVPTAVRDEWTKAFECNGNGVCFDWDVAQVICPSYKATRERVHSPKGRATLLREWLRRRETGDGGTDEIAEATYEAMNGCLGCRACATQCPIHVNIPEMRSRFLEAYHRDHRRPARDYLLGAMEHLMPLMAAVPRLTNGVLHGAAGRALAGRLGLQALPRLPGRRSRPRIEGVHWPRRQGEALAALAAGGPAVALLADAFSRYLDPRVLEAAVRVIAASGHRVVVLPYVPSGKALHVQGFMKRFRDRARHNQQLLARAAETGATLVGIEPSVVVAVNEDYPAGGPRVHQLAAWLAGHAPPGGASSEPGYRLALHCTEQTAEPASAGHWRQAFEAMGIAVEPVATGCCGMAGTYGHLAEHADTSRWLFEESWRPQVAADDPRALLATGYSCRCQTQRLAGTRPPHPVEIMAARLS
ncbi:FAD-binding and (Fe-S)-binding domain-containing protein [Arhodomonas sp. KWT2]|uniref:FAD-binding and (Fe-S)-binding domain-containing protein n=2 Tax=unclassified Arhodomonas TaxID=2621637 RepID=UPI0035C2534F